MQTIKVSLGRLRVLKKMAPIPNYGRVRLFLEAPGTVSGSDANGELFTLGYGSQFILETDAVAYFASQACTVADPASEPFAAAETLTNTDKRPHMSAAEQMVTLALRKMNRKAREMRQAQQEMDRVVEPSPEPEPTPAPTPAPTPEPTPAPEPLPDAAAGPPAADASPKSGASPK